MHLLILICHWSCDILLCLEFFRDHQEVGISILRTTNDEVQYLQYVLCFIIE